MRAIKKLEGNAFEVKCPNCSYVWHEKGPSLNVVQTTDLRSISRGSKRFRTKVYLTDRYDSGNREFLWLDFGEAKILAGGVSNLPRSWTLMSYLAHGATDVEEDSAKALTLPLMCLELDMVLGHNVFFNAIVDPRHQSFFRVPRPGYNPLLHPDTYICQREACRKHPNGEHPIVPEGFYTPPEDYELFQAVKCRPVKIVLVSQGIGNG